MKIKNIVKEHVDELLKQTEQNQKAVLSIALISIIQALKDNPDKYNVIFNTNNTNECQQELVAIVQTFYRNLVDEHVSQTMAAVIKVITSYKIGIALVVIIAAILY